MANNTPEVRFEGFSGEWEEEKAKEIFNSISDKNHPNLPVLSASQEKGMIYRNDIGIDIKYDENSTKTYKKVLPGQFVIHLRSFQGGFAFSNVEGITSPAYTIIDFKNSELHDSLFWKNIFTSKTFIKRLETVTYGIRDGKSISFADFSTLKFKKPILQEQTKIGTFFKQLDDTIALQQQELDTLKQTKQGFLQKMFPKEGETVPEIRFPGFSGEWEERQIREIGDLSAGGDINKSKLVDNGEFPVIANALTKEGIIGYYNEYKIEAPAITITGRGDVGHAKARSINFTPVVRLLVLKAPGFDEYFLENCINIRNIFVESTGVPQLTVPQLGNYKISFPGIEEQAQIGSFFKQLDDTIALHQQELDAMKETKKAFLQKMFV